MRLGTSVLHNKGAHLHHGCAHVHRRGRLISRHGLLRCYASASAARLPPPRCVFFGGRVLFPLADIGVKKTEFCFLRTGPAIRQFFKQKEQSGKQYDEEHVSRRADMEQVRTVVPAKLLEFIMMLKALHLGAFREAKAAGFRNEGTPQPCPQYWLTIELPVPVKRSLLAREYISFAVEVEGI
eukprot:1010537-Pelagomonas_calceolata.AAC.3